MRSQPSGARMIVLFSSLPRLATAGTRATVGQISRIRVPRSSVVESLAMRVDISPDNDPPSPFPRLAPARRHAGAKRRQPSRRVHLEQNLAAAGRLLDALDRLRYLVKRKRRGD